MSKKDRRKQTAEVLRRQRAAEQRRKSWLIGGAVAGVVLLIGALVGVAVAANQGDEYEVVQPRAAHSDNAIVLGDGPVTVDIYIDYMCPACNSFEQAVSDTVNQHLDEGAITVNYHPVAYLNRFSEGTEYSSRSAAAAVGAADAGLFLEFTEAMFANQPDEGTPGLTNEEIIEIGRSVGLGDDFATDVRDQTYRGWIEDLTTEASSSGVTGTPTVMINGENVATPDFLDQLNTAVSAA